MKLELSEKVFEKATEKLRKDLSCWEETPELELTLPKPDLVESKNGLALWFGKDDRHAHQIAVRLNNTDSGDKQITVRDEIAGGPQLRALQLESSDISISDERRLSELFPQVNSQRSANFNYVYGADVKLRSVDLSLSLRDFIERRFIDETDMSPPNLYLSLSAKIGKERETDIMPERVACTGPFIIQLRAQPEGEGPKKHVILGLREWVHGAVFAASREKPRTHDAELRMPHPILFKLTPQEIHRLVREKLQTLLRAAGRIPSSEVS